MREEDCDEYGYFNLDRFVDGDDRRNLIKAQTESYLLYWWHWLDIDDFVQFTLCVLDKFQRSNATDFALIFNKHVAPSPNKSKIR